MDNLIISRQLAQAIANYLMEQKYVDVVGLLQELQKLQPAPKVE